ncbi:MAG: glycine cleavage system protein R [Vampirovibrionales bacterium]
MMSTTQRYLITSAGYDRPGIVAGLTEVVMHHQGNILDAAMEVLSGFFCTLLLVSLPSEALEVLRRDLQEVSQRLGQSVHVTALETTAEPLGHCGVEASVTQAPPRFMIYVSGKDRTGITYHVAEVLRRLEVSIVDLSARQLTTHEPTPVYLMVMEVMLPIEAPETLSMKLTEALQVLASQLEIEIKLEEVPLTLCG